MKRRGLCLLKDSCTRPWGTGFGAFGPVVKQITMAGSRLTMIGSRRLRKLFPSWQPGAEQNRMG